MENHEERGEQDARRTVKEAAMNDETRASESNPVPAVQPHGVLLVLALPDLAILRAGVNAAEALETPLDELLGRPVGEFFRAHVRDALERRLRDEAVGELNPLRVPLRGGEPGVVYDGVAHRLGELVLLELENRRPAGEAIDAASRPLDAYFGAVEQLTRAARTADSVEKLCQAAAERVRRLTGFDRVMVHRFASDGHGEVIAEDLAAGQEPYLGVHYPAGDVPDQARRLYALNRVRLIVDADHEPAPVAARDDPRAAEPLDLSRATLRGASPTHLQYLRAMGVAASLTVSLMEDERLWGLIVCHHRAPKFVPYDTRAACALLGDVLSSEARAKQLALASRKRREARRRLTDLLASVVQHRSLQQVLAEHAPSLEALFQVPGMAFCFGSEIVLAGDAPDREQVEALLAWLRGRDTRAIFHTNRLQDEYPAAADYASVASGLLAVALGKKRFRAPRDFLLFFRPRAAQTIRWAGNPNAPATSADDETPHPHPRAAFEQWRETVRDRARPWEELELDMARELLHSVTLFVLRHAEELEQVNRQLRAKNQEVEDFAYSVSHDLKSPLVSITGFIGMLEEELAEEEPDAEESRRMIERIHHATGRMSRLIDELLELSRVGRVQLAPEPLDLARLVDELARNELAGRLDEREAKICVAPNPPKVYGDERLITHALQNLLSNALKHGCPEPGATIEVGAEEADDETRLFVRDHGPGIAPEYHARIFKLFQRLDTKQEGTGIGLAMVARIAELHGGRVWVESQEGRGATFWLALPREHAEEEERA
jgi:light-regulated signal transduction histidine kinase (bacteriophytochrome)